MEKQVYALDVLAPTVLFFWAFSFFSIALLFYLAHSLLTLNYGDVTRKLAQRKTLRFFFCRLLSPYSLSHVLYLRECVTVRR